MRPASRTIPTAAQRLATTLTVLFAVLLALVPAHAASGPGHSPAVAATSTQLADTAPRADDPCAAGCATQARPRHDPLGERPHHPDHHATAPGCVVAARPDAATHTPAASAHTPTSPCRSAHDRGRAPPAPTGI
ncbi:hypothetical protein [Streptomyces lanatus]|uniref:Secreted protein n=1 Tax=Streptomyces lanatus TaxID=66900 RepID=A0ABV1Y2I0_9ACTN|nr:hypothetical protein [Streptomyces lanatus]GHH25394.1 hypothetical protein GCM10018780_77130 [Streptomyces lanatus]